MLRRRVVGLLVVVSVGVAAAGIAHASGGGACPGPMTNGPSQGAEIENFCYEPTVVHVSPGEVVRWVNRDSVAHTVTGANRAWGGYRPLHRGSSVAYRFEAAGVYPFYCVLHVGMVGAVVAERERGRVGPLAGATPLDAVTRVPDRTPHVTVARARSVPGGGDRGARGQALEFSALAGALALAGLGVYRRHRPRL